MSSMSKQKELLEKETGLELLRLTLFGDGMVLDPLRNA